MDRFVLLFDTSVLIDTSNPNINSEACNSSHIEGKYSVKFLGDYLS